MPEKNALDSFIQIDKNEWKAFLEELSEFEKKYKLLLNKLDMNENRLDALKTPEKKEAESEEASRQLSAKNPEKLDGGEGEGGFPSRLKTSLEPPARRGGLWIPGKRQPVAFCTRCGFQIVRTTRFCQRCGADFGKVVCFCGRELSSGDKFCDRCGREA